MKQQCIKVSTYVLLFLMAGNLIAQESKEEIIMASDKLEEATRAARQVKVKPVYRYVDSLEKKRLFIVALQPNLTRSPGLDNFNSSFGDWGISLALSYEHLLGDSRFSLFIENTIRLYKVEQRGYDYRQKFHSVGQFGNIVRRGDFDVNLSTFDIGSRFYYRQRKRMAYGASAANPFSGYFFFKVKDVLSRIERKTASDFNMGSLEGARERRKWVINPGYVLIGWGTQRRIYKNVIIDFHLGAGAKVMGDRNHIYKELMLDAGLNIGLGLGTNY